MVIRLSIFIYLICVGAVCGQTIGASQIRKDHPVIGNTSNRLTVDTFSVNGVATKYDISGFGQGTVTSVGLLLPTQFSVSGSPVTTSGTLTATWQPQNPYTVLGRGSGTGIPSFLTLDTTWISNFYVKVRSLFSANAPVTYSSGVIGVDTVTSTTGLVNKARLDNTVSVFGTIIGKATSTVTHTGNTANTILRTLLIPANTFQNGDILEIRVYNQATGTAGTKTIRLYFNTAASLTNAVIIATSRMSATTLSMDMWRDGIIRTGEYFGTAAGSSQVTSFASHTTAKATSSINWAVNQYFIIAGQLANSTDAVSNNGFILIRYR